MPEELAKLPAKARDGDVSCVPVFVAAAQMSACWQSLDSASQWLIGAKIEAGFVAAAAAGRDGRRAKTLFAR